MTDGNLVYVTTIKEAVAVKTHKHTIHHQLPGNSVLWFNTRIQGKTLTENTVLKKHRVFITIRIKYFESCFHNCRVRSCWNRWPRGGGWGMRNNSPKHDCSGGGGSVRIPVYSPREKTTIWWFYLIHFKNLNRERELFLNLRRMGEGGGGLSFLLVRKIDIHQILLKGKLLGKDVHRFQWLVLIKL